MSESPELLCILNGVSVPPAEARVPVMDRGFLYGDGVFEVLRTYGGRAFRLETHLARLAAGCRAVGIEPVPAERWRGDIDEALTRVRGESFVRLIVSRGDSARGIFEAGGPVSRVVVVQPLPAGLETRRADGIAVVTVAHGGALDGTPAAGIKAANYLPNVLALQAAAARGAHEAIFVGPGGELREGATSNLFVVRGGRLVTPPSALGILAGITRQEVLAAASACLPVEERLLYPNDLYGAEEAWITSSVREMLPVVHADGRPLGAGTVGPHFRAVFAAFRRRVRGLMVDAESAAG